MTPTERQELYELFYVGMLQYGEVDQTMIDAIRFRSDEGAALNNYGSSYCLIDNFGLGDRLELL
jgi:hypothetical protein